MSDAPDPATSEQRHENLRRTDDAIGLDISLEQYRATNARLKATLAERDAELADVRAELAGLGRRLDEALTRVAGTAARLAESRTALKIAASERDRLHKRVEAMLASHSWRLGRAVTAPVARLSGRRG